jgi:type VI secretion system protein ImpE
LARKTTWNEESPDVFVGLGQRVFTTDGGDHAVMDVRTITIGTVEQVEGTSDA